MNNEKTALDELPELRKNLLNELGIALNSMKNGEKSNFYEVTERLRSGDALLEQVATIWKGNKALQPLESTEIDVSENLNNESTSAQKRGETIRTKWVNSMLGAAVHQVKRTLYRNGRAEILGIAYGQESENRKNRWFLGLPHNKFQSAILLCESLDGKLDAICLPCEIITNYKEKFSKSHGQVKFNITKNEGNWYLHVPATDPIKISENVNKLSLVIGTQTDTQLN